MQRQPNRESLEIGRRRLALQPVSGPSSFSVESNTVYFPGLRGQAVGSRLPVGHPKGLALTRLPGPGRSPKGCWPRFFWPATLTAEGDSLPSRWREGRGEGWPPEANVVTVAFHTKRHRAPTRPATIWSPCLSRLNLKAMTRSTMCPTSMITTGIGRMRTEAGGIFRSMVIIKRTGLRLR